MGDFLGDVFNTWASAGTNLLGGGPPKTGAYMGGSDLSQFGSSPYSSSLQSMISGFKVPDGITPGQVTADTSTYQAKDMSKSALPQYDAMRARLSSQYSQNQRQGQDAIDRQFAAAGGGPGNGAQAKQTENLVNATAAAKSADTQNLDAQEQQTRTQLQQAENDKAFQSSEATKGRVAQIGEFNVGANNQAQQFNAGLGLQGQQMKFDQGAKLASLNQGWDEAQAESRNNEYNKVLSDWQAKHSGGLLGGGGFLGLGLGV